MSAIDEAFVRAAAERRPAFIPYLTAGDPELAVTARLLPALVAAGADLIELGVPFSDPMADGPVNQRAAHRALNAGTTLAGILELVAQARHEGLTVPLVLFSYFNPLLAYGPERFAEQAAASGVDGVLCLDLPPEEAAEEWSPQLLARDLAPVFLLAPTSTKERIDRVAEAARGFVYLVSRTGVTGERDSLAEELLTVLRRVRKRLPLPVAVGFGISSPDQAAEIGRHADGVVVGSALVRLVEEHEDDPQLPQIVESRARQLAEALRECRPGRLARLFGG